MSFKFEDVAAYATPFGNRGLLLASSSLYRKALLKRLNLKFLQFSPDIDGTRNKEESSSPMARRLSIQKAAAASESHTAQLVIGGDQVAEIGHLIVARPYTHEAACKQLQAASGKTNEFSHWRVRNGFRYTEVQRRRR